VPDEKLRLLITAKNQADAALKSYKKNVKSATSAMNKMQKKSVSLNQRLKKMQSAVTGLFAFAIATSFVKAVTTAFIELESRLSEINTIMRGTKDQVAALGNELVELSLRVPKSADELGAGFYQVLSAGITDTAEAMKVLEASSKLAVAGLGNMSDTVRLVTGIMNAYGISTDRVDEVTDVLFKTVERGVTTLPELAHTMGQVIPVAKSAGIELESLTAMIATLTASGVSTDIAVTALRGAINALFAPTEGATKAMKRMGISIKDTNGNVKSMVDIFKQFEGLDPETLKEFIPDVRAQVAVATLSSNYEKLAENVEAAGNAAGAATDAFKTQMDTAEADLKLLANEWDKIKRKVGQVTAGVIREMKRMGKAIEEEQIRTGQIVDPKKIKELEGFFKAARDADLADAKALHEKARAIGRVIAAREKEAETGQFAKLFGTKLFPEEEKPGKKKLTEKEIKAREAAAKKAAQIEQNKWDNIIADNWKRREEIIDLTDKTLEDERKRREEAREKEAEAEQEEWKRMKQMSIDLAEFRFEQGQTELDDFIDFLEQRRAAAEGDFLLQAQLEARITKLKKDELSKREKLEAQAAMNIAGGIKALASINKDASLENFAVFQAASIAQAVVAGFLAVQKALAGSPPPFNFIAAASVGAMTAANVAAIASQAPPSFQTDIGEFRVVPGPHNMPVPATVHGGEIIGRPEGGIGTTIVFNGDFLSTDETWDKLTRGLYNRSKMTRRPVSVV
jgi:TP901 family phage tail tape measure protein